MAPKSLRTKLLLTVSLLVISSGVAISQLVTHRYSGSLFQGAVAEAKNIAHSLAVDAADKILINDLVGLQRLVDDQIRVNASVGYIFIIQDGKILTHTFPMGVPARLMEANAPAGTHHGHLEKILSEGGERFLDIAWPIFEGKAGVVRLGYSEKPYRRKVMRLWVQMSGLALGILILSLLVSHLFIRRITSPLLLLAKTVEKIDEDHMVVQLNLKCHDEVSILATSFNNMLGRIREYTHWLTVTNRSLEEKNLELNRAHRQTRTSFTIAQEIGALPDLNSVAAYLLKKLKAIAHCTDMVLIVIGEGHDRLQLFSEKGARMLENEDSAETAVMFLQSLERVNFLTAGKAPSMLLPTILPGTQKMAVFSIRHEHQLLGALMIACPDDCRCATKELDVIHLILDQSAGALRRASSQEEEIRQLLSRIERSAEFGGLVGKDPQMQTIYRLIEDVAVTDATVLIQGESGTGKELVARAIHQQSQRKNNPFIVINCSAYPATLLESEIFGHERGAFTGAMRQKPGRFEQANGGTVFLDEIGEMSLPAQIKLLRVLQSRKFERLGGEQTLEVDVRVLAATNKNLLERVKEGNFREDLFYRLNVVPINLPPLQKRRNDIPLLARHFLQNFVKIQNKNIQDFSPEAMRLLLKYHWPGNVRELENSVEHAVVLAKGNRIEPGDLPELILAPQPADPPTPKTIYENEINFLQQVLEECNWNKTAAAERLGISRSTLYEKLKKYSITPPTIH